MTVKNEKVEDDINGEYLEALTNRIALFLKDALIDQLNSEIAIKGHGLGGDVIPNIAVKFWSHLLADIRIPLNDMVDTIAQMSGHVSRNIMEYRQHYSENMQ